MNTKGSGWTDEELATLRRMHLEGRSYTVIAKVIGRSRSACLGKAFRLCLSSGKPPVKKAKQRPPRKPVSVAPVPQKTPDPEPAAEVPESRPLEVVREVSPDACGIPGAVLAAQSGTCRWPIGEVEDPGFHFCGAPTGGLLISYCEEHTRRCAVKVTGDDHLRKNLNWAKSNRDNPVAQAMLRRAHARGILGATA